MQTPIKQQSHHVVQNKRIIFKKDLTKVRLRSSLVCIEVRCAGTLKMDEDTLTAKLQHRRRYPRILDKYESYVCDVLSRRSILDQLTTNVL